MPIDRYLAVTAAEFPGYCSSQARIGWMACHFSPSGTGLTNLPPPLPPGSMLILDDSTPVSGHAPRQVAQQLSSIAKDMACSCILLDMERPGVEETADIVRAICQLAPCPVGVSAQYCADNDCAVFLCPPLHIPLDAFLSLWRAREIWLETATEDLSFCITAQGCTHTACRFSGPFPHQTPGAFSRYRIDIQENAIYFSFRRSLADLEAMMQQATGISRFVGLYQQFS